MDSIPESGRSLQGGNGNPLQYACLEKPMDRGAWWATVHGVAKESRHRWAQHGSRRLPLWGPISPFKRKNFCFPTSNLTYIYLQTRRVGVRTSLFLELQSALLLALFTHSVVSDSFTTPWTVGLCPWDFPGKSTGVGCHYLLQPREWAYISCVSCIAGRFFTAEPLRKPTEPMNQF